MQLWLYSLVVSQRFAIQMHTKISSKVITSQDLKMFVKLEILIFAS